METHYKTCITNLKNELSTYGYSHKEIFTIFRIINNNDYKNMDEFIKNDAFIMNLINCIICEREKIGVSLEHKLNDLLWLNERLIQFDKLPQQSKTQALKLLQDIHINIYDLDAGFYEKQTDYKSLRKDLRKNPYRRYPLVDAKQNVTLKCFLKRI